MSAQKFFTKQEFFNRHAPDFNFELDADELIERALLRGSSSVQLVTGIFIRRLRENESIQDNEG